MQAQTFSPLQTFLRYYAAELDTLPKRASDKTADTAREAALKGMPAGAVHNLIGFAETALATYNESQVRELFDDGHFHFAWRTPDAARHYLLHILNLAKEV